LEANLAYLIATLNFFYFVRKIPRHMTHVFAARQQLRAMERLASALRHLNLIAAAYELIKCMREMSKVVSRAR
jgi:uncharacterized protein YecE (DUF72 family)